MRITIDKVTGNARVTEPYFMPQEVFLDPQVIDFLITIDMVDKLEKLKFSISHSEKKWEIWGEPSERFSITPYKDKSITLTVLGIKGFFNRDATGIICKL